MTRGPRPTPTHLRLLRGNPSKRPVNPNEPKPSIPEECLPPPKFLEPYAVEEWQRVAPELHRLGLLTVPDVGALAAYCGAYARWRNAEEVLAKIAANDPTMRGLLVKQVGMGATINPLVKVARLAAADMIRAAGEFGMTPAARSRIAAGVGEIHHGKFDGYLAG
jgi:P27 family predicted phage terminase small subunit